MACLNMLSNEQQVAAAARISFSNDFADSSQHPITLRQQDFSYKEAPVSSDNFEFSVSGYTMISADQVFCKGKLVPLKDSSSKTTTTLRDELLQGNDDGDLFPRIMQPNKGWRERLGLKRSHIIFPRKPAHNKNNNLERIDETKVPDLFNATQHKSK
nr:uncharacterized protein LOC109161660 [Ipomoea trifida]